MDTFNFAPSKGIHLKPYEENHEVFIVFCEIWTPQRFLQRFVFDARELFMYFNQKIKGRQQVDERKATVSIAGD